MCRQPSPGGHLACVNPVCDGRSHVWVHESSAPDRKRDLDARDHDLGPPRLQVSSGR